MSLARILDAMPWGLAIMGTLTLGLAPFAPMPHFFEKLLMLGRGTLSRPIDIFDLVMHGAPWAVLASKGVLSALRGAGSRLQPPGGST